MAEAILDARNVVKTFGGLAAVNDVSFTAAKGEILGIAGPNGSGKSTLFNVITGIPYRPTSGTVHYRGNRIDQWSAHRIARSGVCRTFQKDAEFPDLSPRETILLCAVYNGGFSSIERAERTEKALDQVAFDLGRRDMPTEEISIYEKKQLMIASALVSDPDILMLDEPASGLTKPEIAQLDALLLSVNASGITILLIEHVLSLLLSVSQRLIVLNQGKILAEGDPDHVVADEAVIEAYLGGSAK